MTCRRDGAEYGSAAAAAAAPRTPPLIQMVQQQRTAGLLAKNSQLETNLLKELCQRCVSKGQPYFILCAKSDLFICINVGEILNFF